MVQTQALSCPCSCPPVRGLITMECMEGCWTVFAGAGKEALSTAFASL